MTTFEHAMLGINGALAVGLHRRFGWQIVAMCTETLHNTSFQQTLTRVGFGPIAGKKVT